MVLESLNHPVPLNSVFYIERPPIESQVYEAIHQPGSIIRIKAPSRMGKRSLLNRIMAYGKTQGYYTILVDFCQTDSTIFENLSRFLRWFCLILSVNLEFPDRTDEYWDEEIGSKVSCILYLQSYILESLNAPLVLVLNETNRLFEYPTIAQDFFSLLRSWYEEAKQIKILKKMRLVVAHSTAIYIPLNLNQSPFNIGLPITLPPFTLEQIQELAQRHDLDWIKDQESQELMNLVGGHPYLIRLALYHLMNSFPDRLESILQNAPKPGGIYQEHLQEILTLLNGQLELIESLKLLVKAKENIHLDASIAYKLESMGLVKLEGFKAKLSCELYRLFLEKSLFKG